MRLLDAIERASPRGLFLLGAGVLLLTRLPTLFVQVFDLDETVQAVAGWVWANGGTPYIDFVDHKPPLQWFFYRIATGPFGLDLRVVHAFTILVVGLTVWAVYIAVRPLSEKGARWAAVLYLFQSASYKWHDMLSTDNEVIFNLPIAFSLAAYIHGGRSSGRRASALMFLSGVLVGIGFWIKPQAGMTLAAFGLHVVLCVTLLRQSSGMSWLAGVQRLFWIVAGFLAVALAMVGWASYHGILKEMLYWTFSYNLDYVAAGPKGGRYLYKFLKIPLWMVAGTLLSWIGSVFAVRAWQQRRVSHEVWVFLFFVLVTVVPVQMGRFYLHYFIQFYPGLFAAGGIGLAYWISTLASDARRSRWIQTAQIALLLLPLLATQTLGVMGKLRKADEEDAAYWAEAGRYVDENTPKDATFFVWGFAAPFYYWAKRTPATKFLLTDTSVSGYIPGSGPLLERGLRPPIDQYVRKADRDTLLAQLSARPPEIILDTSPGAIHHFEHYPLATFPELKRWIDSNYRIETHIGGAALWRKVREPQGE